jgi:hypothetical protein
VEKIELVFLASSKLPGKSGDIRTGKARALEALRYLLPMWGTAPSWLNNALKHASLTNSQSTLVHGTRLSVGLLAPGDTFNTYSQVTLNCASK